VNPVTPDVTRETLVPSIPEPRHDNLLEVVRAIRETIEVREGLTGDPLDQAITLRDLYTMGKLDFSAVDKKVYTRLPGEGGFIFITPSESTTPEYNPPPKPTGFTVTGALTTMILTWDKATYPGHAYTEVWRSGADNLGTAVRVGTEDAAIYSDKLGLTGAVRYYWIRHVSKTGVPGPYNATAGTVGTSGLVLTGDIGNAQITTDKYADGSITTAKYADGSVSTINIGDGQVSTAKIGDLQVTTTKMANGSVTTIKIGDEQVDETKIGPLAVTTPKLAAGAVVAGKIATNAIVAGDGVIAVAAIGTALIADLAVTNGKIGNLAVDNAKISDMNASKITAGDIDSARMQTNVLNALQANITQLSAIRADMGTITAGTLTMNSAGSHIKIGQTAFDTGTGIWVGNDGGTPKISVGSPTNGFYWGGSALVVRGSIIQNGNLAGGITGDKIATNTMIVAGTGTDIAALDGADSTYRIYAGHSTPSSAPFSVEKSGRVNIKSATSGARLELVYDTIRVYDSGGTLRVKIGNLA